MPRKKRDIKQAHEAIKRAKQLNKNMSSDIDESGALLEDYQICLVTSALLFAVYTASLHPSVPGGDSGELIIAAHEVGVAHPPGYPLFTMLSKAAMMLIRYGSPAWRVNLLNAAFAAATGGFLQMTVLRLTCDVGTSLLTVGLFCLSQLTWMYSVSAEVFSLNNCLLSVIIYLTVEFEYQLVEPEEKQTEQQMLRSQDIALKIAGLGCVICGFALCNQHTSVLYVAPIALWVLLALFKKGYLSLKALFYLGAMAILGLLPYLYIPLSSHVNIARWTWGDQRSLAGFITHLFRSEYGTFDLGKGMEGQGFIIGVTSYFHHSLQSMLGLGPMFALVGCIASVTIRQNEGERSLFIFIFMLAGYISFFAWRANLDMSDPLFKGVVERFWLQSDLVVALLAAVGFSPLMRWLTEKLLGSDRQSLAAVFTMISGVSVIAINLQHFQECNQSGNVVVRDFASTILNRLPQRAIVLTKGDLPTNSMRYLHLVEGYRPDLTLIDVEVLSYEWSLPMMKKFFDKVNFPGDFWSSTVALWESGKRSFSLEMFLNANYDRAPLFACIGMTEREESWRKDYTLWPFGPCLQIVKKTEKMNPKDWAETTKNFAKDWKYPVDSFPNTSWERVANDEMWNSKISSAFYMYGMSEEATSGEEKSNYLITAYELYFAAIKSNQESGRMTFTAMYPSFWHKNFALVCERLLYVESHHSKAQLCKTAVYHFEQYLASSPSSNDPEASQIREAISSLKQRVDTYEKLDRIQKTFEPKV